MLGQGLLPAPWVCLLKLLGKQCREATSNQAQETTVYPHPQLQPQPPSFWEQAVHLHTFRCVTRGLRGCGLPGNRVERTPTGGQSPGWTPSRGNGELNPSEG